MDRNLFLETVAGFLQANNFLAAEQACQNLLEVDRNRAEAYLVLGLIRKQQGQLEPAKIFFEIVQALQPGDAVSKKNLARIYDLLGDRTEQIGLLKQLLGQNPFDDEVIESLTNLYANAQDIEATLSRIRHDVDHLVSERQIRPGQKVLFGLSFSIYEPSRVHDFLLSQALRLRGASIIPLTLASEQHGRVEIVQEGENNIFGGVWGGYTGNLDHDARLSAQHNRHILETEQLLWQKWAGLTPIPLTRYLTETDRQRIRRLTHEYPLADYENWRYGSMPVGQWAIDVLVNNELVGEVKVIPNYQEKLYHYLYNILLLIEACSRALDDLKPDVIVSNDTFYYQWAILEALARARSIPCYNQWSGSRRFGWCYALDEPAMKLNMDKAWQSWQHCPLSAQENKLVDTYLSDLRPAGKGMILNTAQPAANGHLGATEATTFDFSKPTALLASNVIWDLAALNKDYLFDDLVAWVRGVLDFFKQNQQYQLILKTHPGEKNKSIPLTRQRIADEVRRYMPELPPNIILLEPDTSVSIYDLIPHVKVGLVYTTTVGIEMSVSGKPVVTCAQALYRGKGFTYDPETTAAYFETIQTLLQTDEPLQLVTDRITQAKRFFHLYYFRYFTSLNLFDHVFEKCSTLYLSAGHDLLPGQNPVLDYVTSSILTGQPIFSETHIPPAGGYRRNQYDFKPEEVITGGKIVLGGYPTQAQVRLLETNGGPLARMAIGTFEFYVIKDMFKRGELEWIYDEVFLPAEINPHAYETAHVTIAPGDVVLDLGACEGFFVNYALQKQAQKVYAIEPHPQLMMGLKRTYSQQVALGQVNTVQLAISNYNGYGTLNNGHDFICEAKLDQHGDNGLPVMTLDNFVSEFDLPPVNFIKADVEGEELKVIEGAAHLLRRFKPKLAIAVYHDYDNARRLQALIQSIRSDYVVKFGGCYMFETPFRPYMLYAY